MIYSVLLLFVYPIFTPGKFVSKPIPRIAVSCDDIKTAGKIDIKNFHSYTGDVPLSFKKLNVIKNIDLTTDIDLLWDISLYLHPRRPSWSGMMQSVHQGVHPREVISSFSSYDRPRPQ